VSFGTVECAFSPDTPVNTSEKTEVVPTRAELEYLRRENHDLEARMAAMQKQIDILSSARLMTKDTQQLGVTPDVHRRVQMERDEARNQLANLHLDLEHLRADVAAMIKERDALRRAWETVKQERDEALTRARNIPTAPPTPHPFSKASPPPASVSATPVANSAPAAAAVPISIPPAASPPPTSGCSGDTVRLVDSAKAGVDHRAMATVLTKAPAALKATARLPWRRFRIAITRTRRARTSPIFLLRSPRPSLRRVVTLHSDLPPHAQHWSRTHARDLGPSSPA
jgi:hypothetical protein